MNTPTPETDKVVVLACKQSSDYRIKRYNCSDFVSADFARKLERERDDAVSAYKAIQELDKDLCAERDQLRKDVEFLKSKECEAAWCDRWKRLFEENTQLRKVADELSLHLKNHQDFCSGPVDSFDSSGAALHHYNSLPHVIAARAYQPPP